MLSSGSGSTDTQKAVMPNGVMEVFRFPLEFTVEHVKVGQMHF